MTLLDQTVAWLTDSAHWVGPSGIPIRLAEHVGVTILVMVIAAAIAIPLGILIGHTGRGTTLAVAVSGGLRALPTLGLVTLIGLWVGIGLAAPVVALVILAIPPMLAGTYAGIQAVERDVVDASRAVGLSEWAIIWAVEMPLAARSLIAGVRAATLQVISTVTVAAYVADAGLGRYIFAGLATQDYGQMIGGAVLIIALALTIDTAAALIGRVLNRHATPHLSLDLTAPNLSLDLPTPNDMSATPS